MDFRKELIANKQLRQAVMEKVAINYNYLWTDIEFVRNHAELSFELNHILGGMIVKIHSFVLGKAENRIDIDEKWPINWWQALRERWAPNWWLRRWPVKYRTLSIHKVVWRVCPHLDIKTEQRPHIVFLENL